MSRLLFLIPIFVFSILSIFELDCKITHILRSAYQVKIAVQNHCVGQTLWKECLMCALPFRLVCILSTVQTRCCIPQSASVQAGRPFHYADMDSLSHWYSLLLHLTPSQQGTCTLMYSLYLSVSNQSGEDKKQMWAKPDPCMYVWVYWCYALHTQAMSRVLQLFWHSVPVVPGWAMEQSK